MQCYVAVALSCLTFLVWNWEMCTETIETNGISEIVNLDVQLNSLLYTTPHVSKFCICSETKKSKNGL